MCSWSLIGSTNYQICCEYCILHLLLNPALSFLFLFGQGTVVLVFQPAEEVGGGAKKMLDAGVLENVEAIFGLHVSTLFPIGTVASRPGPILAASAVFEAVINGKGGHAAIPQHAIDPILAASNVIVSLQHLVSREADPLDSQVVYKNIHARLIPDPSKHTPPRLITVNAFNLFELK